MPQNSSNIVLNIVCNYVYIAILCAHLKFLAVTVNCFHDVAWLELAQANDLWWVKGSSMSVQNKEIL